MTLFTQPIFLLIFIPLLGVLVILFINNNHFKLIQQLFPIFKSSSPQDKVSIESSVVSTNFDAFLYNIALFFSLFNLLISIIM